MSEGSNSVQTTDVIVWLEPPPIPLEQSVAGRSWDVRIGGVPITLMTPVEGRDSLTGEQTRHSVGPIPNFPDPPLQGALAAGTQRSASLSLGVPSGVFVPAALRLRFTEPKLAASLTERPHEFPEMIGNWLGIVRDWVAAWSGHDRETIEVRGAPAILAATSRDDRPHAAGGDPLVMRPVRAASVSEWSAALAAASDDSPLPLQHQLVAEAMMHGYRQQYRLSVVTAASAAEVGLAEAARARLISAHWPDEDVDDVLKVPGGLVELYRLNAMHRRLPVSIRQVRDQLADPRNRAAHGGESPDRTTVDRAIKTARGLLDAVSPLPPPESFLTPETPA